MKAIVKRMILVLCGFGNRLTGGESLSQIDLHILSIFKPGFDDSIAEVPVNFIIDDSGNNFSTAHAFIK
jgi:hypothetical protein